MKLNKKTAFICPLIFGLIMLIIGICIKVPGGALTTYSSLNGQSTDGYYTFDDTYVSIDEYVGGDAYNYEIGASLVAGRTAGMMISKSIFITCGLLCLCAGITLRMLQQNDIVIAATTDKKREESSFLYENVANVNENSISE